MGSLRRGWRPPTRSRRTSCCRICAAGFWARAKVAGPGRAARGPRRGLPFGGIPGAGGAVAGRPQAPQAGISGAARGAAGRWGAAASRPPREGRPGSPGGGKESRAWRGLSHRSPRAQIPGGKPGKTSAREPRPPSLKPQDGRAGGPESGGLAPSHVCDRAACGRGGAVRRYGHVRCPFP